MNIGRISEVWRYPVKSMGGEKIPGANFDIYGMIGDRTWATVNTETGDVGWGKTYPKLMDLEARYTEEPASSRVYGDAVRPVAIRFPGGEELRKEDDLDAALSEFVGAPLHLSPLEPPENREHYRWQTPADYDAILKTLGIQPDDPPPDLSVYDENLIELLTEYFAPPGTYNDLFPVHALTTSSIEHMQRRSGESFPVERFRPSFLIETLDNDAGLVEFEWVGKKLKIGDSVFGVEAKTIRCSMPSRGQAPYDLPPNPAIAESLFLETRRFFGAYLSVLEPGKVHVDDSVMLVD
jgi:uncharacterized protein YcbX